MLHTPSNKSAGIYSASHFCLTVSKTRTPPTNTHVLIMDCSAKCFDAATSCRRKATDIARSNKCGNDFKSGSSRLGIDSSFRLTHWWYALGIVPASIEMRGQRATCSPKRALSR